MKASPLIVITGPTAVGKTKLAIAVAHKLKGEIINADSRQVYKKMDIGTGKDLADYTIGGEKIPYHLIDICEPGYQYNIKEYQLDFDTVYQSIQDQQKPAILCGGSGLYIESAIEGNPYAFVPIHKKLRDTLHDESKSRLIDRIEKDIQRQLNITSNTTTKRLIRAIEISEHMKNNHEGFYKSKKLAAEIFVLTFDRATVKERIIKRLRYRLEHGLIEEVKGLLAIGLRPEQLLYYGLEYRWVTLYVMGELTYEAMFERLNIAIRQFAKRQMTWFRRMEKRGYQLNWLDGTEPLSVLTDQILKKINSR